MFARRPALPVCAPLPSSSLVGEPHSSTPIPFGVLAFAVGGFALFGLTPAHANTIGSTTVASDVSVYATPSNLGGGIGPEVVIPIAAGTTSVTFSVTETGGPDTVSVNGGGNYNDPDGVGSASTETITGTNGLSGIVTPQAGVLDGAFTDGTYSESATTLNYITTSSTSAASYSPTLDQVFFIGDGLTGDGSGTTQIFYVPTGATELTLGLADACSYNGTPSCYGDNTGSFTVNYDEVSGVTPPPPPPSTVPEPSSLLLLGTGALGIAGSLRRRVSRLCR